MDKEIDIYEYDEWWGSLIGFLLLFIGTIILFGLSYLDLLKKILIVRQIFYPLIMTPIVFLAIFSIMAIVFVLLYVPRMVIFRQENISILYTTRQDKTFSYSEIKRLVLGKKNKFGYTTTAKLYFADTTMIYFNPYRMVNFPVVVDIMRKKGLNTIIEQK